MELKNQPINKRVHKTLCINFRACAAFFPKVMYISLLDRNDVFKWVANDTSRPVFPYVKNTVAR